MEVVDFVADGIIHRRQAQSLQQRFGPGFFEHALGDVHGVDHRMNGGNFELVFIPFILRMVQSMVVGIKVSL